MRKTLLTVIVFAVFCSEICAQTTTSSASMRVNTTYVPIGKRSAIDEQWMEGGLFYGFHPNQEMLELRTEYSKKFDVGGDVKKVVIGGPFHYKDSNGAWQDIDLEIRPSQVDKFAYSNTSNRFSSFYSDKHVDGIAIQIGSQSLVYGINTKIHSGDWTPEHQNNNSKLIPNANFTIYKDIYKNIDLEYELTTDKIQHYVRIQNKDVLRGLPENGELILEEEIEVPRGAKIFDSRGIVDSDRSIDGFIYLVYGGDTTITFYPTRIWDATFEQRFLDLFGDNLPEGVISGETNISFLSRNRIKFAVRVPSTWLLSQERVYPVIIDPTIGFGDHRLTYSGSGFGFQYPWRTNFRMAVSQTIYSQQLIGVQGNITHVKYFQGVNNGLSNSNATIRMRTYSNSTFPSTSFIATGWTTVLSNTTLNYTSGSSSNVSCSNPNLIHRPITLSSGFQYTNGENLIIETRFQNQNASTNSGTCGSESGSCCVGGGWYYFDRSGVVMVHGRQDNISEYPSPRTINNSLSPVIELTISTSGCTGWSTNPIHHNFASGATNGNTFTVNVTSGNGCSYSAVSNNPSWITNITYPGLSNIVSYNVGQNDTGAARSGTISIISNNTTVATFTVNQAAGSGSCTAPNITFQPPNRTVTAPAGTSFSVSASGGTAPYSYQWQRNTGSGWSNVPNSSPYSGGNSATLSISSTATNMNSYGFRCVVSSGNPCPSFSTTSNEATLTVNPTGSQECTPPSNPGNPTSNNPQSGSVTLTRNGSPPSGVTWYWQGTSCGTNTTLSGATYTANTSGTYYIRAFNTSTNCWSTGCGSVQVTVNSNQQQRPVPSFSSTRSLILPGEFINFTGTATNNPTSWKWTFHGGTPATSTIQNPVNIRYNSPGGFPVSLEACNSAGCETVTIPGYVNVRGTTSSPTNGIGGSICQKLVSDPIQVGTCTYMYGHTDFSIASINGKLEFSRYYNSINNQVPSMLGYGWSHTYDYYITNHNDDTWDLHYPDGHISTFVPIYQGNGESFSIHAGTEESLVKDVNGNYKMTSRDQSIYDFNSDGKLIRITDTNGNVIQLRYAGNDLISIEAPGGRTLTINTTNGRISSINDPLGRTVSYQYDGNGNLISVRDAKNGVTRFSYNANGKMLSIVNPLGHPVLTNTYDSQGRVTSQRDAFNQTVTIAYDFPSVGFTTITYPDGTINQVEHDSNYRMVYERDELNNTKRYEYNSDNRPVLIIDEINRSETRDYDALGNMVSQTLADSRKSTFTYNNFSKPLSNTDPNGRTTNYTYDNKGNLVRISHADNSTRHFSYNANGSLNRSTDGMNNNTFYNYNAAGDLVGIAHPSGNKSFGYDNVGRVVSASNENNRVTRIEYDANDNVTQIRDALDQPIIFTYNQNNKVVAITDKGGGTSKIEYDAKGRVQTSTNALDGTISYIYDARDNLIMETDERGNTMQYSYDAKGRRIAITNALGQSTKYEYDKIGNVTKITDAKGRTSSYTYTITNKIESITDAIGNKYRFAYDANDNLVSVTDALGHSTKYSYDPVNRMTNVVDADGKSAGVEFDANGNMIMLRDPNGRTQSFSYNASNRLTTYLDAAGNRYSFEYDNVGNVTAVGKPTGTITNNYDEIDRLVRVVNSSGDTYSFSYDENDNIKTMSNNLGTSSFTYDELNRLVRYTDPFGKTVRFEYDKVGNRTSITYPGELTVRYEYDAANNMKSVTDWLGNSYLYSYDATGQITRLTYPNGIRCEYTYDDVGRLLEKKNMFASGSAIINKSAFTLDANGKRIREERQGPIATNLRPVNVTYNYSPDDGLISDTYTAYSNDKSGNRTFQKEGAYTIGYNFTVDNLLVSKTDQEGTTNYGYNPLGNRLKKTTGEKEYRYVLDLSDELSMVLQITNGNGAVQSHFIYGVGLLAAIMPSQGIQYYHFDAQHNTVALTNASGQITDTYAYDPFGTMLEHIGETSQPFTFLGHFGVEQENAEFYYVRARYYDANNGRFISKDPYPFDLGNPQLFNRFVYSLNDPIRNYDYNGLYGLQDVGNIGGDALGTILEYFINAKKFGGVFSKHSSLVEKIGNISNIRDAGQIAVEVLGFAADMHKNQVTASKWLKTLKTVGLVGGGLVAAATLGGLPLLAVSSGLMVLNEILDYKWQKNNWDCKLDNWNFGIR